MTVKSEDPAVQPAADGSAQAGSVETRQTEDRPDKAEQPDTSTKAAGVENAEQLGVEKVEEGLPIPGSQSAEGSGFNASGQQVPKEHNPMKKKKPVPVVIACYDSIGKCSLDLWNERLNGHMGQSLEKLRQVAKDRQIPDPDSKDKDKLLTELMAMEELFELSYPQPPSWASVEKDLIKASGRRLCFVYVFTMPKQSTKDPIQSASHQHPRTLVVSDQKSFQECLDFALSRRSKTNHPCGIVVELIRHVDDDGKIWLDLFDANHASRDEWLGEVEVGPDPSFSDFVKVLEDKFQGKMTHGCSLAYIKPTNPGKWKVREGFVKVVSVSGRGWPELVLACNAEPDRKLEVDVKFSPTFTSWTEKNLARSTEGAMRKLRLQNPYNTIVHFDFSTDQPEVVKCQQVDVKMSSITMDLCLIAPQGGSSQEATITLRPKGQLSDEPFVVSVKASWN
mmetsp:Transcript_30724/g.48157  ORF Transcript_30724/g.48157 Transcript_30724/m.48157 type:complete len:450 (+) Transcript_30724:272-1621(+)